MKHSCPISIPIVLALMMYQISCKPSQKEGTKKEVVQMTSLLPSASVIQSNELENIINTHFGADSFENLLKGGASYATRAVENIHTDYADTIYSFSNMEGQYDFLKLTNQEKDPFMIRVSSTSKEKELNKHTHMLNMVKEVLENYKDSIKDSKKIIITSKYHTSQLKVDIQEDSSFHFEYINWID